MQIDHSLGGLPAVQGSNPKHTIYAFSIHSLLHNICQCDEKRTKLNKKRPGWAKLKKNRSLDGTVVKLLSVKNVVVGLISSTRWI